MLVNLVHFLKCLVDLFGLGEFEDFLDVVGRGGVADVEHGGLVDDRAYV